MRVTIEMMITSDQFEKLKRLAVKRKKSISACIEDFIDSSADGDTGWSHPTKVLAPVDANPMDRAPEQDE